MTQRFITFLRTRRIPVGVGLGYLGLVFLFVWIVGQFYIPGMGFSYLIGFGSRLEKDRISKVRNLDYYVERHSDGYDAQYYVQMAIDPSLQNTQLRQAVDNLAYRGRRILMPAAAYVLGRGKPATIVQAFAILNALCLLALATVLLHWFPPVSWNNFFRWAGVLFSVGICVSLRNSLIDGPSLLLIAFGVYLLEKGWGWWSTAILALSGLGKETNLLGAAALLPVAEAKGSAWWRSVLRGILVAVPLALWLAYLATKVGSPWDSGIRNFDLPLVAYAHKWREVFGDLDELNGSNLGPLWSLCMLVSLTVQFGFLVLRPQWNQAWWRVGITFAVLMVFLGEAVWEGYPGAASRVLLPMQLAFNVLVPTGRKWLWLLLAGNLTVLIAPSVLQPPTGADGSGYALNGRSSLLATEEGKAVIVKLSPEWYGTESGANSNYWTWAPGNVFVTVVNPHPVPLQIRLRFGVTTNDPRIVGLRIGGKEIWQSMVLNESEVNVKLGNILLPPGENRLEFFTDRAAAATKYDSRPLAFSLRNFRIDVLRTVDPAVSR